MTTANAAQSLPNRPAIDSGGLGLRELSERYRILAKLGAGGMADVFLAVQADGEYFERFVVVKRMRALPESEFDSTRMFMNEARVVASLNHPHIVKVFDLGRLRNDIAFAMEYIDGESLETLVVDLKRTGGQIPIPIALKLIIEAAEALHYAHCAQTTDGSALNLIHRDIGPQNLLLTSHGYLKVIDFGVAKSAAQLEVTTPGLIKGKIPYFAPESLTGPDLDGRADLYSLGLVMFELLTLQRAHPFSPNAPIAEVVQRITSVVLPPVSAVDPDIPTAIARVVSHATKIDRRQRFQTGAEFAAAIRHAGDSTVGIATTAQVEAWFRATFVERRRMRRTFERRALAGSSTALDQTMLSPQPPVSRQHDATEGPRPTPPPLRVKASRQSQRNWRPVMLTVLAALVLGIIAGTVFGLMPPRASLSVQAAAGELLGETSGVVYMATNNLLVESDPPGAEVLIDGQSVGTTGETGLSLRLSPTQEHEVLVRRDGYRDYRLRMTGESFGQRQIRAELTKTRGGAQNSTVQDDKTESRRRERSLDRPSRSDETLYNQKRRDREARKRARLNSTTATDSVQPIESELDDPTPVEIPTLISAPMPPPPPPLVEQANDKQKRDVSNRPQPPIEQSMGELMSRRTEGSAPEFPRAQMERGVSASVLVRVKVSAAGEIENYAFESEPSSFTRAVERAIQTWKFEPYKINGEAIPTSGRLRIEFRLK